MKGLVTALIVAIIVWLLAGLILWGAVECGKYFFALGDQYKDSPGANIGAKIGGVILSLTIAGAALPFIFAGFSSIGAALAVDEMK